MYQGPILASLVNLEAVLSARGHIGSRSGHQSSRYLNDELYNDIMDSVKTRLNTTDVVDPRDLSRILLGIATLDRWPPWMLQDQDAAHLNAAVRQASPLLDEAIRKNLAGIRHHDLARLIASIVKGRVRVWDSTMERLSALVVQYVDLFNTKDLSMLFNGVPKMRKLVRHGTEPIDVACHLTKSHSPS